MNIKEYPIHQHELGVLEVIYVLRGSINIDISLEKVFLPQDTAFAVNSDTLHYIYNCSEDNMVAVFHMDMKDFAEYFHGAEDYVIIFNTADKHDTPEMVLFAKQTLLAIANQYFKLDRNPQNTIRELMISFLLCMVNHFQSWHIEENAIKSSNPYKDKVFQINRLRRMIAYIYNNYSEKITLDTLAAKEYVSKYYISHMFTEVLGKTFQETITHIRCDEAQKWVHGTQKSIEEIASKCGFSSVAYFRKSYAAERGVTPLQDRKLFKNKTIDTMSPSVNVFDDIEIISDSLARPSDYIYFEPRKYKNASSTILIDFSDYDVTDFFHSWRYIYLNDVLNGLTRNYRLYLKTVCEQLGFNGIAVNADSIISNYYNLHTYGFMQGLMDFIYEHDLRLYFTKTSDSFKVAEKDLTNYCQEACGINAEFGLSIPGDLTASNPVELINAVLSLKNYGVSLWDIINEKGLKKPLYNSYYLLNKLDNYKLESGNNYIVTSSKKDFHIMLFNRFETGQTSIPRDFYIKLSNISDDYLLKTIYINSFAHSEADVWRNLGAAPNISNDTLEYIKKSALMPSEITRIRQCPEYDMFHSLKPGHGALITIEKI